MKKFLKIVGIIFLVLIVAAVIMGRIAEKADGPRQSVKLYNSGDSNKSVTFEKYKGDTVSGIWYIDEALDPDNTIIKRIPEGKYLIKVWDENDDLVRQTDYSFALPNPEESNYHLLRFDIADAQLLIVNLNALYEGNSFAEHMSNAVGTNQTDLKVEKVYPSTLPFMIPDTYEGRTFIDLNDDIPKEVKYGEVVYGLISLQNVPGEKLGYEDVAKAVTKKLSK